MKTKLLALTIAAALPATFTFAQNDGPPRPPGAPRDGERKGGPRDGDRPKGEGPRDGQRPLAGMPMAMPFLQTLDADDDGILSADEIKDAPAALQKLDKNGDGKLTRDEWQPPMRPGPQGEGERPGGPRDGERPRGGPRDGERPRGGPRDGERPRGGEGDEKGRAPEEKRERPDGGERTRGERSPAPPLVGALDADRDGALSAEEIAQSSAALAKLDQNKDGQLGPREYGPRPPREGGPGGDKPAQ